MEEFRTILPSPSLAPYVKTYWLLKTAGEDLVARTVPTGMMGLVFHRGRRLLSLREGAFQPRAFLCGHERTFDDLHYDGQVDMIFVTFRPAGARAFFDLPLDRLAGQRLDAGDMEDGELVALERRIASTENDDECIALIERFLILRLTRLAGHNLARVAAALRLVDSGESNVSTLAAAACLSHRQFDRVFSETVGAHPKEFSRIVRFQRALHLMEHSPAHTFSRSFATLAADCGWFDQSHMIRDFRSLSGYTPREYLALCPPHSDYFG